MITNTPTKSSPYLFDKLIGELQQAMIDNLPWLDYSFGRTERLVKTIDERKYYTPNIYKGNGEYELILPDDIHGCYSFFELQEPQVIVSQTQIEMRIRAPFAFVVWVDMRSVEAVITSLQDERNTEYVKEQVLGVFETARPKKGHVSIENIYERAENVFQGYTLDEVDNQFLMSPFAGFRFTGTMTVINDCVL